MGKQGPCTHCGVTSTPLWRNGPPEKPVLCNACGSRWRTRGTLANYMPLHAGGQGLGGTGGSKPRVSGGGHASAVGGPSQQPCNSKPPGMKRAKSSTGMQQHHQQRQHQGVSWKSTVGGSGEIISTSYLDWPYVGDEQEDLMMMEASSCEPGQGDDLELLLEGSLDENADLVEEELHSSLSGDAELKRVASKKRMLSSAARAGAGPYMKGSNGAVPKRTMMSHSRSETDLTRGGPRVDTPFLVTAPTQGKSSSSPLHRVYSSSSLSGKSLAGQPSLHKSRSDTGHKQVAGKAPAPFSFPQGGSSHAVSHAGQEGQGGMMNRVASGHSITQQPGQVLPSGCQAGCDLNDDTNFLLTHPSSPLAEVDLQEIVGVGGLSLLTLADYEQLSCMLATVDLAAGPSSVRNMLQSKLFLKSLGAFSLLLGCGVFNQQSSSPEVAAHFQKLLLKESLSITASGWLQDGVALSLKKGHEPNQTPAFSGFLGGTSDQLHGQFADNSAEESIMKEKVELTVEDASTSSSQRSGSKNSSSDESSGKPEMHVWQGLLPVEPPHFGSGGLIENSSIDMFVDSKWDSLIWDSASSDQFSSF